MFLEQILEKKQTEIALLKENGLPRGGHPLVPRSLAQALKKGVDGFGLIAEVKKASPSKGVIRHDFDPVTLARRYEEAGAQALSVLTDQFFFQGDIHFLRQIREAVQLPLLRKDFIIDKVQIDESIAFGADAILLIAAALTDTKLADLSRYAQDKGLEVLLEVHTAAELDGALAAKPNILGINNRNLHTFDVSLDVTRQLVTQIPQGIPVISESGISHPDHVTELKRLGLSGMLVGEYFMRQDDVGDGIRYLLGVPSS